MKTGYFTEHYCKLLLPPTHRSTFTRFRCRVAHIRIKTGRYESLAENQDIIKQGPNKNQCQNNILKTKLLYLCKQSFTCLHTCTSILHFCVVFFVCTCFTLCFICYKQRICLFEVKHHDDCNICYIFVNFCFLSNFIYV